MFSIAYKGVGEGAYTARMSSARSLYDLHPSLRTDPEAVIVTTNDAQQAASLFTVPLLAIPRRFVDPPTHVGCGVFVRLADKYFLLTAGHVVDELGLASNDSHFIAVYKRQLSAMSTRAVRSGSRYCRSDSVDFGYIEITFRDAAAWEAGNKIALGSHHITVGRRNDFMTDDDYFIISGTPRSETRLDPAAAFINLFVSTWTAPLAGRRGSQHADHFAAKSVEFVDVALDPSGLIIRCSGNGALSEVPLDAAIEGASGGPCWKANVAQGAESWSPRDIRLIGTHAGRFHTRPDNGAEFWVARQTLVGHHLRLIADEYAGTDTAKFILDRWPQLDDWPRL